MIKYTLLIFCSLCMFNIAVHARPVSGNNAEPDKKEQAGLGLGAIIGGLIGGPPGAILGAAGGAWFGNRESQEDIKQSRLEQGLIEKQAELVALRNELQHLQGTFGQQLHKVKMEKRAGALQQLSQGVSLTVYFRTDSAEIGSENIPRIRKLAKFLRDFPEIQLQLEAHADHRGHADYNKILSKKRADTIAKELIGAGIDAVRIHSHAYGETAASSAPGDEEAYVFDRRVSILLTLDTET